MLQDYVVEETTANNEMNEDKTQRLFYSTLDQVINEIHVRFSHLNTKLYVAVSALQPKNSSFLDVKMAQLFLIVVDRTSMEAEFDDAKTYEVHSISFQTFLVWTLLLTVHTKNFSPLQSILLRHQCTCCTVPTTSGKPPGNLLV